MDYNGKKIAIVGLARSGLAAAKLLIEMGADVFVSDTADTPELRRRAEELQGLGAKIELGGHSNSPLREVSEIVLSPGVPTDIPILLWAKANRPELPIISEVELGYRFVKGKIIGITGSNGKSTTVSLLGAIFDTAGFESYVVGNIGRPLCDVALEASEDSILCVELSSFQLESIYHFRPFVACILNLSPDHLDRHYEEETYYAAKERIFVNQTNDDYAVLSADDSRLSRMGEGIAANLLRFSCGAIDGPGAFVNEGSIVMRKPDGDVVPVLDIDELGIPGPHNLANACAAVACTVPFNLNIDALAEALREFGGLPHRLQTVGRINGISFINDSKATNVDALECALNSFDVPLVLIAGGYDKGADFKPLRNLVGQKAKHVVLIGDTAKRIETDWTSAVSMEHASSLDDAVLKAKAAAVPEGIVLLAPGSRGSNRRCKYIL